MSPACSYLRTYHLVVLLIYKTLHYFPSATGWSMIDVQSDGESDGPPCNRFSYLFSWNVVTIITLILPICRLSQLVLHQVLLWTTLATKYSLLLVCRFTRPHRATRTPRSERGQRRAGEQWLAWDSWESRSQRWSGFPGTASKFLSVRSRFAESWFL